MVCKFLEVYDKSKNSTLESIAVDVSVEVHALFARCCQAKGSSGHLVQMWNNWNSTKQLDSRYSSNKNPNKSQAFEEDVFFVTGRSSKSSCDRHWNKMFWDSTPSFSHTLVLIRAVIWRPTFLLQGALRAHGKAGQSLGNSGRVVQVRPDKTYRFTKPDKHTHTRTLLCTICCRTSRVFSKLNLSSLDKICAEKLLC